MGAVAVVVVVVVVLVVVVAVVVVVVAVVVVVVFVFVLVLVLVLVPVLAVLVAATGGSFGGLVVGERFHLPLVWCVPTRRVSHLGAADLSQRACCPRGSFVSSTCRY